jgi:hypothetical protein
MKRTKRVLAGALALLALAAGVVLAQEAYTSDDEGYTLELPTQTWKALQRPDGVHQHTEFVNGDRTEGYLRIRKEVVAPDTKLSDFARNELDTKLRFLPGFVANGKEERFSGRLNGVVVGYEYTNAGKQMAGRSYYLQADSRTVFVLNFTGLRDKLQRIQNQTDAIARSFRLK